MMSDHEFNQESEGFLSEQFLDGGGESESPSESPSSFSEFLERFQQESTPQAKIRMAIDFMRTALSSGGTPRFKDFWEGRKLCLPCFKEEIPAKIRAQLWSEYIELSIEAKRLKTILDEQSAFAIEQIELAIQALERDLTHAAVQLSTLPSIVPKECMSLQDKSKAYDEWQNELSLFNTLATRINGLRKEVVKTEMRIRIKNRLLERLSLCGDQIFPRRKELIKKLSQEFMEDVQRFVDSHFQEGKSAGLVPSYALREEIKQLQSIAKKLTLNTHAFTKTRLLLSQCWDFLRDEEKEKKKQTQEKRQLFKQNFDIATERIRAFKEKCDAGLGIEECQRESQEIAEFLNTLELYREDVKSLKEAFTDAKRAPFEKARAAELESTRFVREAEEKRREELHLFQQQLKELLEGAVTLDLDVLQARKTELAEQLGNLACSKTEKHILERSLKQLRDIVDEKKAQALLDLPQEDRQALGLLEEALQECTARRSEIKAQLEHSRKLLGGSGLDFEKAMLYRELIEEEKQRLERVETSIAEIEEKIETIEGL